LVKPAACSLLTRSPGVEEGVTHQPTVCSRAAKKSRTCAMTASALSAVRVATPTRLPIGWEAWGVAWARTPGKWSTSHRPGNSGNANILFSSARKMASLLAAMVSLLTNSWLSDSVRYGHWQCIAHGGSCARWTVHSMQPGDRDLSRTLDSATLR